ncbi:MAG: hypothetical protein JO146_08915, partial [Candidatus Eremiobacteraeota bacterium]|nr:hypothetical protein [Candidatus Eremiobacteraeota bacterium]
MRKLRLPVWVCCGLLLVGGAGVAIGQTLGQPIVVVPIEGTVDDGMAHLVERSVA